MSETPTLVAPRKKIRRWSRWLLFVGLAMLAIAGGAFYYITRPERLRDYAQNWLDSFTGGEAHIERVELHLHGLQLIGLKLAIPAEIHFDPHDNSLDARTLLRASKVNVSLDWRSLLSRSLSAREVVAFDPDLTFVLRDDGVDNWQAMLRHRKTSAGSALPARLPAIQLRNAQFMQYRLRNGARIGAPPQTIWAQATPSAHRPSEYDIPFTRLMFEGKTNAYLRDTGRLRIDMDTLMLSGQLPNLRLDELLFVSTPEVLHWMDLLHLKGTVRPEQIELGGETRRVTLGLSGTSLAIPFDESEQTLPPERRYLRFQNVHGRIELANTAAQIVVEGSFRGSTLKITGAATLPLQTGPLFESLAFDLKVEGSRIPLPRDEPDRDPSESRWVHRWKALSNFVRDFDAVGVADLFVHLRKSAGPGHGIEILAGDLRPQGVSARYIRFPYRVNNLTGLVHFRPDHTETIDLKGIHNASPVTVTGWEGGYKTQAGDLKIRGGNFVLDDDLRRCLTPEDQSLVERFALQARMDLDVHMIRADAPPGTPDNPWKSKIDVTLLDGTMKFDDFPYPLGQLNGGISVSEGAMQIVNLSGRRQDAIVRVNGSARWAGLPKAEIDLQLEAQSVPLDGMLAEALPHEMQKTYRQLGPTGRFDLSGRLQNHRDSAALGYDLNVHVKDASVFLPTNGKLTAIDSKLRLQPDRATIESLQGSVGVSQLTGDGWIQIAGNEKLYAAHVASDSLHFDAAVRDSLPGEYQELWDDFAPSGAARVDFRIEQIAQPEEKSKTGVDSQPSSAAPRYRLAVEPLNASATYESFPLPLRDLRGSFVATNEGVEIKGIQARSGDASISFSGNVEPVGEHRHTRLRVQAKRLKFDESLRRVLPPRIRRHWDTIQPRGELDVEFQDLDFTTSTPTGSWRFDGQADLHNVDIQLGPKLSEMNGRIGGSVEIGEEIGIDAKLALDRVRVDGRLVTNAAATLDRASNDSVVHLRDFKGSFYEGNVTGHAEIDYLPVIPTFSVNLAARGFSLEGFLNAKRDPKLDPVRARGLVNGSMTISGKFDAPGSRRGEGDVNIRQAQVFKIPLLFSILQVLNLTLDDNAFHDASLHFNVEGPELLLNEIDLRGKALSMVGSGRVDTVSDRMNLTFLVGPAMRLPRIAVLTELLEGVARELMEVRVEGRLGNPIIRAEMVRSLRKTIETLLSIPRRESRSR